MPDAGTPAPARDPRRHDLDALRGFAMLLGIVLHAVLAFFPSFWPVVDNRASLAGPFDEILWVIHGFRMPVFFLLSGYFTAMLWRRRGIARLVSHRARRVALPLLIGMVTIAPLMNRVSDWAIRSGVEEGDLFAAVLEGDAVAVKKALDDGFDPSTANPADPDNNTALHYAAWVNEARIVELLIERGANFYARNTLGSTPLDVAVWFGHSEAADALVEGGHLDYRVRDQEWPDVALWGGGRADSPYHNAEDEDGLDSWVSSFHHMWFLWFLCWYVAGFAAVAALADRLARRRQRLGLAEPDPSRWRDLRVWLAVPLVLLPQLAMGGFGAYPVFGPDTSVGLIPAPHVLAFYGLFFAFGALAYGRRNRAGELMSDRLGRRWPWVLPVSLFVVLPAGLWFTFEGGPWWLASVLQVAYAWGMSLGLIGLFSAILSRERRWVRYLSDSSYWLYLAHLPLVIALQVWARGTDWPRGIEFALIVIAGTAMLLVSYAVAVRHTPIGWLLNGRRPRRSKLLDRAS